MAQDNNIPEGHITLKEAAKLSGYAPDYIGQLIRKGKLYGKQVYVNVAWVTTEEALRRYIAEEKKREAGGVHQRLTNTLLSEARLTGLLKASLYAALAVSVALSLFLFYALSVNLDRSLERKAFERALEHAAE